MLWSLVHRLLPLFEDFFEGIVDKRVELVWIRLDEVEVQHANVDRFSFLLLPFGVLALKFLFNILDVL